MNHWVVFLFGLVFIGIIVGAIFAWRADRKRRDALRALAAQNGWSFVEKDRHDRPHRYIGNEPFGQGHSRYASDIIGGRTDGAAFEVFDYHYAVTRRSGKTTHTDHYHFKVGTIEMPLPAPVRVAHVVMTDRFGEGIVSATVQDACGGVERPATAWPTQIACGHVDAPLIADDREVMTAHDVIDRVRAWDGSLDAEHTCHRGGAASGSAPCEFAWLPVFVCDIEEMGCEGSPLLVEMEHTFRTGIPHEHALPFEGYARWETMTPTSGRIDLGSGLPRDRRSEDVRPVGEPVHQTTPLQAEPVVYAPVAPAALAMGGLLLILVSVLARLGHWMFGGGAGPALAAFYARVTKQDALSHSRREEIMQVLREDPGLTLSDLASRLGVARTPTLHHLETLRRTGHTTHVQNGRRRHWFAVESTDPAARVALAMEQDPVAARFLAIVRESPGLTVSEIADRMDRSKHAASRTGSRLEALGLVVKRKEGRTVRFEVASSPSASLQRESVQSDGVVA